MRLKTWFAVVAAAVIGLNAFIAYAAVPVFTGGFVDTTWWQGQKTWLRWSQTSDNGTAGKPTHTMGINWGDGTIEQFATASDTSRSHVYESSGSYTVYLSGVNVDGTGLGHFHLTVNNGRSRYVAATGGKVYLSPAMRRSYDQITISAAIACKIRTWRGGLGDERPWPIAAGVPWTIPANYDSLAVLGTFAAGDTVWVHVW